MSKLTEGAAEQQGEEQWSGELHASGLQRVCQRRAGRRHLGVYNTWGIYLCGVHTWVGAAGGERAPRVTQLRWDGSRSVFGERVDESRGEGCVPWLPCPAGLALAQAPVLALALVLALVLALALPRAAGSAPQAALAEGSGPSALGLKVVRKWGPGREQVPPLPPEHEVLVQGCPGPRGTVCDMAHF